MATKNKDDAPAAEPEVLTKADEAKINKALDSIEEQIKDNPNLLMRLIERAKNNPTLSIIGKQNAHSAKMAGLARGGKMLLTRIRNNILRPMLPEQYRGILDNPLVCGIIDLALGNALLFVGVEFGDKLPEKIRPYALKIGEATMYSAYSDTFGTFDLEDMFTKLMSGEVLTMFKGFVDADAA